MILEVVDDRWGMKVKIDDGNGDGDGTSPRGQSLLGVIFHLWPVECNVVLIEESSSLAKTLGAS
jgi:hypothetical protein